jgi:hypothetical protein
MRFLDQEAHLMRRVIKRSSSTEPGNDDGNPELVEFPDPESADAESSASKPPEAKRSKAKPTKLPLWDFLEDDERDTDGTTTVLYRLEPIINRRHGEHFIAKKSGKLTREDILQEFGSGVYQLIVKDVNNKLLYKDQQSFHNHKFPPQMDPAEVVAGDPRNEVYLKVWGKRSTDGDKSDKGSSAPSDMNTVLNTVLDKTGSFDPKLADLWEKTARERDELSKVLAQKNAPPDFVTQAKAFKELFPQLFQPAAASSPPGSVSQPLDPLAFAKAMKDLQPDQMAMLVQAKEIFAAAQPAASGFAQFREVFGFARELLESRGGGGRRNGWDVALDLTRELGPSVVQPVLQLINNIMVLRSQPNSAARAPAPGMSAAAGAGMPSAFDPYANPEALRQHARMMNNQPAAAASAQGPATAPNQAASEPAASTGSPAGAAPQGAAGTNELLPLVQNYGGLIVNALNNGTPGYDFADYVARLFGTATHAMIAGHGEEPLCQSMLSAPELAMFGEGRVRKFVHEFIDYETYLENLEGGDEAGEDEHVISSETKRAGA